MAVDDLSQAFLRVLLKHSGEATTTMIRDETDMTRGQVNHRFNKLENREWISIDQAEQGKGERTPPKIASLTDEGRQAIQSGQAGKKVLQEEPPGEEEESIEISHEEFEEFQSELDGVKNQLNVVVQKIGNEEDDDTEGGGSVPEERLSKLEREVGRLRETVEMLNEAVGKKTDMGSGNDVDAEVVQDLKSDQEYLNQWMEVAEKHMNGMEKHMQAMQLAIRENSDVTDFDSYLERVRDSDDEKSDDNEL